MKSHRIDYLKKNHCSVMETWNSMVSRSRQISFGRLKTMAESCWIIILVLQSLNSNHHVTRMVFGFQWNLKVKVGNTIYF